MSHDFSNFLKTCETDKQAIDVTWNRERLGNLLLFGQALQSSKAPASSDHLLLTGVLPVKT